jgi:hypothetical protein
MTHDVRYARTYGATNGCIHRVVMLHRPVETSNDHVLCPECSKDWPCTTFIMIEEAVL